MTPKTAALLTLSVAAFLDAAGSLAAERDMILLPSGAEVYLQETLSDSIGDSGLTYRYRFVMPDLASRVPSTSGPAGEFMEDAEGPLVIDTEAMAAEPANEDDYIDDGMIAEEDMDFSPVISIPGAERAADDAIDRTLAGDDPEALPPAPEALFKDPIHDDVMWLCDNVVLKEALKTGKRPRQIVISLADRESPFGSYDPDVLQLFEAFSVPPTRDICEWRPW